MSEIWKYDCKGITIKCMKYNIVIDIILCSQLHSIMFICTKFTIILLHNTSQYIVNLSK